MKPSTSANQLEAATTSTTAEGRRSPSVSTRRRPSDELLVDDSVLIELEAHARSVSANIDMALRDLRGSLRGMADLTLESSQLFSQTINSTCDQMDSAIKATYSVSGAGSPSIVL
jgi:BLOC-1-related complex sub-unit 6